MTARKPFTLLGTVVIPLAALAVVGCGGGSSGNAASAHPKTATAPKSAPAPKQSSRANNGIPQNNGGDSDADNNGGPDDGDGGM